MNNNSHFRNSQRSIHGRLLRTLVFLGVGLLGIGSFAACAKARAASVPDGPPLQVPEPPQRVLAPVEDPLLATTPPVVELDPPVATAPPPRTPPSRPAPEPKPQPSTPPVAAAPPPAAAPPRAPVETRELRPASPTTATTERSVRDLLARATRDLGRVDYGRLNADGRAQYEQSKRFSTQAEEALRERNLVFAATLADKAATLAAELLQR